MKSVIVTAAVVASLAAGTASIALVDTARQADPRPVASTVVLLDGPGDVWRSSESTSGFTLAPRPDADVLRAKIAIGADALHVKLSFDNLRRAATQWYRATVRTADASYWYVLEAKTGHWSGRMYRDVEGEWVRDTTVGHSIDYAGDVVKLTIPYSSVGNPAWVQVRLRNDLGLPNGGTFFADNPGTHGELASFSGRLRLP